MTDTQPVTEFVFPAEEGNAVVVCDDREMRGKAAMRLFELGTVLKPMRLHVGDFVCSPRVVVERKTAADFEASIIDGRLFVQAGELASQFPASLIVVVGGGFERVHSSAIRGALLSLSIDFRIPVLFVADENEFAELLHAIAVREQLKVRGPQQMRFMKPTLTPEQSMQFIIESLPGIGPKTARELLEHFGSVEHVFTAEAHELEQVDGVGEQKAADIRRLIERRYKT